MAKNGTDFLLYLLVGGSYQAMASSEQRTLSITETTAAIDTSSKASRSGTNLPGRYGCTISHEGLYVANDAALAEIKSAMRAGTQVVVRLSEDGTQVEQATCTITSFVRNYPDQDNSTYSIELTVDGDWSTV